MTGCPLAYADPCRECAQYGNCSPSQAAQKMQSLEKELRELRRLLEQLVANKS